MVDAPGTFQLKSANKPGGGFTYMWTLLTDMGQTVATSAWFPDRASAERGIEWVKTNAPKCPVDEPWPPGPSLG
jgi:uncharacterized protein YegP (UPF0339 family)